MHMTAFPFADKKNFPLVSLFTAWQVALYIIL